MRRRVALLFVLTGVLFLGQEWLRRNMAEPFPALLMPGFASGPEVGETYAVTLGILEARDGNGRVQRAPATELTKDAGVLPDSVLRLLAFEQLTRDGWAREYTPRSSAGRRLLGQHVGRTRDDDAAVIDEPEVTRWLRDRTQEVFKGSDIVTAKVEWHTLRINRHTEDVLADDVVKQVRLFPR